MLTLPIKDIILVPEIFQYIGNDKLSGYRKNDKLDGNFDRNLAQSIVVWKDNSNFLRRGIGTIYVVDGHLRIELALRSNVEKIDVFYLNPD